jgi:hypothetical protein
MATETELERLVGDGSQFQSAGRARCWAGFSGARLVVEFSVVHLGRLGTRPLRIGRGSVPLDRPSSLSRDGVSWISSD